MKLVLCVILILGLIFSVCFIYSRRLNNVSFKEGVIWSGAFSVIWTTIALALNIDVLKIRKNKEV